MRQMKPIFQGVLVLLALCLAACSSSAPQTTPAAATIQPLPDFVIKQLAGSWGPPGTACGDAARSGVTISVQNQGKDSARDIQVLLVGSPAQTLKTLDPDQTLEVWVETKDRGNTPVTVIIDPENKIQESDETNNQRSETVAQPASCSAATGVSAATAEAVGAPTVEAAGGDAKSNPLTLRYNDQFITISNSGANAVAIETIAMHDTLGIDEDSFSNAGRTLGLILKPNECVVIRDARADGQVPSDWNCTKLLEATLNKSKLFWRADAGAPPSDDKQFTVEAGGEVIGTCDTAGRAVGRMDAISCEIEWPLLADTAAPTATK